MQHSGRDPRPPERHVLLELYGGAHVRVDRHVGIPDGNVLRRGLRVLRRRHHRLRAHVPLACPPALPPAIVRSLYELHKSRAALYRYLVLYTTVCIRVYSSECSSTQWRVPCACRVWCRRSTGWASCSAPPSAACSTRYSTVLVCPYCVPLACGL